MRWKVIILVLSTSVIVCVDKPATKGAVTEGLFILKNKTLSVKKAIQVLKKELTECFVVLKPHVPPVKDKQGKKVESQLSSDLEIYHCKLKQLLYPSYIDELGVLVNRLEEDKKLVEEGKPISTSSFEALMKKSFLLTEKMNLEKKLFQAVYVVDKDEHALKDIKAAMQKRPDDKETSEAFIDLSVRIKSGKAICTDIKTRLHEVNAKLFVGDLTQEVFLDKLAYYSS